MEIGSKKPGKQLKDVSCKTK